MPTPEANGSSTRGRVVPGPFIRGQVIDEAEVVANLRAALDGAARAARCPAPESAGETPTFASTSDALAAAIDATSATLRALPGGAGDDRLPELVDAQAALFRVQQEVHAASVRHRSRTYACVHGALATMHAASSVPELISLAPAEVCRCGFDRAILSRVHGTKWVAESVHVRGDPAWAAEILDAGRAHPQELDDSILETELLRRREAIMVHDVQGDSRVHRPIADTSRSRSYVAAPIMPEGRVIGFVHADCYVGARDVDAFDAEVLQMLADGLGPILGRTVQLERLSVLRGHVRELTRRIGMLLDEVADAEIEVGRIETLGHPTQGWAAALLDRSPTRLDGLLTRRELEIVRLLARGASNRDIAARLVISEATVRTHVSNILKKLDATNRTEAVSRFVALLQDEEGGAPA